MKIPVILERDHMFLVDETRFILTMTLTNPNTTLSESVSKPYWVGYCDVPMAVNLIRLMNY
ncbi:MAG: hypothetical protein ACLR5S_11870 [Ruminococcus sp.]